ncbi:MAG: DUF4276 family protein [Caldilineaceae bacterium]|nr:DUF4276 family protein [Caldilineaceae bacterium]
MRSVLSPFLAQRGIFVSVRSVETSRSARKIHRGGLVSYIKARNDLMRWMKEAKDWDVYFTTMFDLYGLPTDFPRFDQAKSQNDPYAKVADLERAFGRDVADQRFIPYIQLHEFEALLFADVSKFDWEFLEHERQIRRLQSVAEQFDNPELIDQGRETAPSKRIISEIPEYENRKTSAGPIIAEKIGIDTLRKSCPHFGEWVTSLEGLGTGGGVISE